ncbi:radical SAM protein [Pseudacidobacterium ailaaui]|uniref:radical SAM protein n=1 Tax=Pseudacidobacterium ailaaui TaxID=1382359 RepID=UPI00047E7D85|nr:radical SAM protein [Pseudacidobacterium ailaaui]MBX6359739.1 radical SAM protein [Pseudacidobacterium ailaaui]MCL6463153.1 radical SAM protein [Pseudacidobacterium ailaaui]MDI3255793.1 radical SAM protein [Bacillota bacterium]
MIRYEVVGLLYTMTCPLTCAHCIVESSPKAQGKMKKEVAEGYLRVIPKYSDTVCFTGGEPFLYFNEVLDLVRQAKALGLKITMVSGAGWVRVDKAEIARERVSLLKEAGLNSLCISWDEYHEAGAPREQPLLLASLANECGLQVLVRSVIPATCNYQEQEKVFAGIPIHYQPVKLIQLGAAKKLPKEQFYQYDGLPRGRCSVVYSPAIEPDGNVYACCGPGRFSLPSSPLILGNTNREDLDTIFARATADPIFEALALVGPYGLHEILKDTPAMKDHFHPRRQYSSICDLCIDICDTPELVATLHERMNEADSKALLVAARLWYAENQRRESCGHAISNA